MFAVGNVAVWRNRDTLAYLALISLSDGFVYSRIKVGPAAVADDATVIGGVLL
jgi:hypothetical protein